MTRLTKEREAEIKEILSLEHLGTKTYFNPDWAHWLLAEIDALRAERGVTLGVGDGSGQLFVHGDYESIKACQKLILERDELKQKWETACWSRELHLKENDELKQYKIAALKELHRLKAENEILTKVNSDSISILEENQKLSSRIAKLREALNLFGHVGNDTKCCEDCTLRIEALAQDDEMEEK